MGYAGLRCLEDPREERAKEEATLMRRNANNDPNACNDPKRNPNTAFGTLDEDKYRAERDLIDRYQSFVADLLRLSLLGVAVFGFLYKIIFEANLDSSKLTQPKLTLIAILGAIGVAMFGISATFALLFRFLSTKSLDLYIEALRFTELTPANEENAKNKECAKDKLDRRHLWDRFCERSKFIAALALGLGGALEAFAVFLFIFDLGRQTGA
jgi:hypothetical protein